MAETLEEIRKHVEELIRRLSEVESEPVQPSAQPTQAPMNARALGDLETTVIVLGTKVDQAGNLLAQVTDLLESQAERLETLEMQVGEPDALWDREAPAKEAVAPPAPPVPEPAVDTAEAELVVMVSELVHSVRTEIGALASELCERVQGLDGRISHLQDQFEEAREMAWQHRREIRDLEDRLLTVADASMREPVEPADAPTPSEPPKAQDVPRLGITPSKAAASHSEFAAIDAQVYGTVAGPPQPMIAPIVSIPPTNTVARVGAPDTSEAYSPSAVTTMTVGRCENSSVAAVEPEPLPPMDARTVRRLEELVEREVRLQQEFKPGAVASRGRRSRLSVMVVDDLPDARKILSIYLSRTGYQVVTASGAEDCLAKLRHHEVDAIVLDASMPGGGGAQVCRTLREDAMYAGKRHLPVIIYTSYPDEYPPSVVEAWGATDYVVKGGDMLPLITALVRHTKENQDALS